MLQNVSVGTRLYGLTFFLSSLLAVIGFTGLHSAGRALEALDSVYRDNTIHLKNLKVIADMYAVDIVDTSHKVRNGNLRWHEGRANVDRAVSTIDTTWKQLLQIRLDADEKKLVDELIPLKNAADAAVAQLTGILKIEDYTALTQFTVSDLYLAIDPLSEKLNRLTNLQLKGAEKEYVAGTATYRKNKTISITAMLLGIVMGAFFSFGIVRSITRPLTTGVELADRLANGDLTAEITVRGSDETGHLMTALKSMSDSLRIIINQISRTSSELASSAQQLSLTADHISTGTEKVSIQVGTVATAGEQMSATSADIARNCQMAAEGAQQAALTAINSAEVVRKTLAVMEKVAMQVHSSARSIEQLGTHSVQIGAIVDTIKDIADQTNLLALNAAIEAARAGDQGRGFAVVADEVRALSTRTTKATQEIGGMIKTIQKETEEAIRIMEQGVLQVETGTLEAARSGEALQEILAKVNDVVMQVNQIATAVEQQSATTREISGNMLHVTEVVRQTSQDAEESAAMATQLNVNAKELQRLVQQFRL